MAAEQDANEANIETAKCAKEAAVAKEEAPVDISLWVKFPASLVFFSVTPNKNTPKLSQIVFSQLKGLKKLHPFFLKKEK